MWFRLLCCKLSLLNNTDIGTQLLYTWNLYYIQLVPAEMQLETDLTKHNPFFLFCVNKNMY